MPRLNIRHVTTYRYKQPVAFGEHRMMLRPREGHDQRMIEANLDITPSPMQIRSAQDAFGNHVAIARFAGRADLLRIASSTVLDHTPAGIGDFHIDEHARTYPFSYGAEEMPDLLRCIERHHVDASRDVDRYVGEFLRKCGTSDTRELLTRLTLSIKRNFTYVRREERGIQEPAQTLKLGRGSCRDFAMLMIEAVRALGLAARFVSGYLHVGDDGDETKRGGGSTHAWAQVYLPGAGWVDFDPTSGIVGNRDLVRVAVVRDPRQAVPLHGTWIGFPSDSLGMTVEVRVCGADLGFGPANGHVDRRTISRAVHSAR